MKEYRITHKEELEANKMEMQKRILAVRIYFPEGSTTPMADLKMADGVTETIVWTDVKQRKQFETGINGYTLIYDERPKREWSEWG